LSCTSVGPFADLPQAAQAQRGNPQAVDEQIEKSPLQSRCNPM
jgi:hypothetical protein